MSFYSMRNPSEPPPREQQFVSSEEDDWRTDAREPYCQCDLELTEHEEMAGKCAHCGGLLP